MPCRAITDSEIERCFHVLAELRPHLMQDDFLATVRAMEEDGFRLTFIEQDAEVVAAAGHRIYSNLFMGRHCYVDDLVTAAAQRSKGFGKRMIGWLHAKAQAARCRWFHLDSGAQRFTIASYHFNEELAQ